MGKTAALRQLTRALNPHRYQVVYLTDALWQQYETDLVELIMQDRNQFPASQMVLDFDDDLPF